MYNIVGLFFNIAIMIKINTIFKVTYNINKNNYRFV